MARLLAKAINCQQHMSRNAQRATSDQTLHATRYTVEPCNQCLSCAEINAGKSLDLIEIDAASHTGVDHVRELTDSANVAAPQGGHKIFIIDEVHMLSKAASNAL